MLLSGEYEEATPLKMDKEFYEKCNLIWKFTRKDAANKEYVDSMVVAL